jgi:hypothetical protein
MEDKNIRKHLIDALNEIIDSEKIKLHRFYDDNDADGAQQVTKMVPIIRALNILKDEIGEVEGLEISTAAYGHMAIIDIQDHVSSDYFKISTNIGNTKYEIERLSTFNIGDYEPVEEEIEFDDATDALKLVMEAIGKHIASKQVFSERGK